MKALIWLFGLFIVMPLFVLTPIMALFGILHLDLWLFLGGIIGLVAAIRMTEWVHSRT